MGKFKYRIEAYAHGFLFALYPSNSNTSHMGHSNYFATREEAMIGLAQFRILIKEIPDITSLFSIEKKGKFYKYQLNTNRYNLSFTNKGGHEHKKNAEKALESIKRNIDAELQ